MSCAKLLVISYTYFGNLKWNTYNSVKQNPVLKWNFILKNFLEFLKVILFYFYLIFN